jgi:hypothetical protein
MRSHLYHAANYTVKNGRTEDGYLIFNKSEGEYLSVVSSEVVRFPFLQEDGSTGVLISVRASRPEDRNDKDAIVRVGDLLRADNDRRRPDCSHRLRF